MLRQQIPQPALQKLRNPDPQGQRQGDADQGDATGQARRLCSSPGFSTRPIKSMNRACSRPGASGPSKLGPRAMPPTISPITRRCPKRSSSSPSSWATSMISAIATRGVVSASAAGRAANVGMAAGKAGGKAKAGGGSRGSVLLLLPACPAVAAGGGPHRLWGSAQPRLLRDEQRPFRPLQADRRGGGRRPRPHGRRGDPCRNGRA